VPEVDTPGHASALLGLRPDLKSGRNEVEYEFLPGHRRRAVWLDPELPATFELMEQVLARVAAIFPDPYLHIGADEPRGMPDEDYVSYVRRLRHLVRSLGRHPLGWQESARAGLGPDDVVQYWLTGLDLPASVPPQVRAQVEAEVALSRRDAEAVAAASVPVIASPLGHCYLDVPYADRRPTPTPTPTPMPMPRRRTGTAASACASTRPRPSPSRSGGSPPERSGRAGPRRSPASRRDLGRNHLRLRRPVLSPAAPPAGVAHRAWSDPRHGDWAGHRDRLARHGRLWAQDGLTYFRAATVDWA